MNIASIGNSYNKTLYDVGESIKSDKSVPVQMGAVSQDMYVHSQEESSYVTYTPNGRVDGEDVSENESEQLNILPERYKKSELSGKVYYQGELITYYELIQTAVEAGAISLDESKTVGWNMLNAENALIDSKATPLYDWSTTLYSEDRMYVYRVENGKITGATATWYSDGTTLQDVAGEIASGTPLSDIDRYKLHDLMLYDIELYDAAVNIGIAKREYDTFTNMYQNGQLTEKQFKHDCYPLLLLLFGKDADINSKNQFLQLSSFFGQDRDAFLENAFANYNPSNQFLVNRLLIEKEYHSYSGIY
ncbi:hypothetical protein D7V86_17335 [bacterium D16-51]|nr:hypothetical protein D7V96_16920 [bacterium D16-59]RKI57641.1 hypothetical protein D7V86_17335 [bacterium D16-51]